VGKHRLPRADRLFGGAAKWRWSSLVTLVGVFLVSQAVPALSKNEANFLTSRVDRSAGTTRASASCDALGDHDGSIIAMAIAVPSGSCVALFITEYAPQWLRRPAATLVDLLAAVPSIVYRPLGPASSSGRYCEPLEDFSRPLSGGSRCSHRPASQRQVHDLPSSGIVLAIMILPIITAISREVFAQTPTTHKEGALALGATRSGR
jgi:phosphate transport system permease protein